MVTFGEEAKNKKAGNLNLGSSYVITTVMMIFIIAEFLGLMNRFAI
jgi:hypothetical protein